MTKRNKAFLLIGLLAALLLAGGVSYYASDSPDGLNRVAADKGLDQQAKDHAAEDGPLAGYSVKGIGNERLSGGLAGVAGVGITLLAGTGLVYVVRRRNAGSLRDDDGDDPGRAGLAGQHR
jgi:cobalt/nickel transport system permease protein